MFDRQCAEQELDALWARPAGHCRVRAAGGGATGITGQVDDGDRRYFLKWLPGGLKWLPGGDPLDAEADGLRQLAPAIRVPAVIHRGPLAGGQALILEWLDLRPLSGSGWETLGVHLRRLHDVTAAQFGHHRSNWIGANRQDNTRAHHWADFFVERRLAPQLRQARDRGLPPGAVQAVEAVMARTPDWLAALEIRPALVHGDLWQGNLAALADGTPVLYDPAVYHGHGETDLAMLGLFGTVPDALYHGYGLDPHDRDFQHRTRLYNLYHLLKEPLNTALRTQRGLKCTAVVSCLDGQGGALSKRQGAAAVHFRPRPAGLAGCPTLIVPLFRQATSLPSKGRLDCEPACKPEYARRYSEAP